MPSPGGGSPPPPARAPLLFGIGVHIEPMGVTAQGFQGSLRTGPAGSIDYRRPDAFAIAADDIELVAAIAERRGGRLTIQA